MTKQTEKKLSDIFTKDVIEELKTDKSLISSELLSKIRSYGNSGKKLALEILDIEKDEEQYYLDAFGNRISCNGNRLLKKRFTKIDMADIHIDEMRKCKNDIHYFKENYIKIKTRQGVNFPDLRPYQDDFINDMVPDENEGVIGLMGRQCCTGATMLDIIKDDTQATMTFEDLFNECKNDNSALTNCNINKTFGDE